MDYEQQMNFVIEKSVSKNDLLLNLEEISKDENIPIILPQTARFLEVICAIAKPFRILEIGTAIGYSAIVMSNALNKNVMIDTIETNRNRVLRARENIKVNAFSSSIRVIYGDAIDVLKCLHTQYDMIFVDAAKGQYIEFLPECERLLKLGGIIVSDNVFCQGLVPQKEKVVRRKRTMVRKVDEYVDKLFGSGFRTSIMPLADGIALSVKESGAF